MLHFNFLLSEFVDALSIILVGAVFITFINTLTAVFKTSSHAITESSTTF